MITTGTFAAADPVALGDLRERLAAADPLGRLSPIGLREVVIGPDGLDQLPRIVGELKVPGDVVIIQDATPMRRSGADLKPMVAELLSGGSDAQPVRVATIGRADAPLHADAAALAEADRAIAGAGCVIAVGSGTITDIAKDATHRAGDLPYVVVETAVSVNAFSDNMAVLLRDGVKRTVPSRWPDALVIDREVIAAAPPAMNRAGYGELASMFTAPADWYLASVVGVDASFHPGAVALVRDAADAYLQAADGVAAGDPAATQELARIMTLSGIALGVAGRTAPLSGTEHLVSHLLDMDAAARGHATAFHGAQVGVASVIVALAWERLLADLDPDRLLHAAASDAPAMHRQVSAAFAALDGNGSAAAECWRAYEAKLGAIERHRDGLRRLAEEWDEHRRVIGDIVIEPARLVDALRSASAPVRFRDLNPPVDEVVARWAVRNCFLMRDRLTMADIAHLGGLWDDAFVDRLFSDAARLGAGL